MLKLFKATATVSIVTIITTVTGVIRSKYTAVVLGPAGMGIFAQAMMFQQLAITIATLGIGLGTTKYIAQYKSRKENDNIAGIISSSIWMQVFASMAVVILCFSFSAILSKMIFSNEGYSQWVGLISLGAPFLALAVTADAILLGFGDYIAFTRVKSLSAITALILLFIFVGSIGLNGIFVYLAVVGLVTFLGYCYFIYKNIPRDITRTSFKIVGPRRIKELLRKFNKQLLSYGGVSFVTGVLSTATLVGLRALLIRYLGVDANGYYQVVFVLSAAYLPFFTNGLWAYFYPKISTLTDARQYSIEVNHALRLCIFGIIPFIVCIYLFRTAIIYTVFTGKFMASKELFATQLYGDFLFILYYIMATSLLASARLKAYLISGVLYTVFFIGLFIGLKNFLGIKAITVSYLISNMAALSAVLYYHAAYMGLRIYSRNIKLFLSSAIVCGIILFAGKDRALLVMLKMALLIFWLFFLPTDLERRNAVLFVVKKLRTIYGLPG